MSPPANTKRDVSLTWPRHDCGFRHATGSKCPPVGLSSPPAGVWLVRALCPQCRKINAYCPAHHSRQPV